MQCECGRIAATASLRRRMLGLDVVCIVPSVDTPARLATERETKEHGSCGNGTARARYHIPNIPKKLDLLLLMEFSTMVDFMWRC
jgi:hypothetical protein